MPRLKLTVAYVGTAYCGWQTQLRKDKYVPTIQQLLEKEVSRIVGEPTHVHGAGRTDSGVHAEAQVAHVDIPEERVQMNWQLALNTCLPRDVRIVDARLVDQSFHAQFGVAYKVYEYRIWLTRRYVMPQRYPFVWDCGPVDLALMDEAAGYLIGTHDFASLCNAGSEAQSTVRTVLSVHREPAGSVPDSCLEVAWQFQAQGFLKQMVRNCMGLLVSVGQKKIMPSAIPDILSNKDRRKAPPTAPARGLALKNIVYF